ncbi:MAG TPA: redoxin family protein, partial [Candidatus Paceibacterota bacterium]
LRGKVVLVDFWTYSCINCLRTLPYEKELYDKYKDQGLVIVGVHTPEFAFEHVESNVADAVKRLGITYPVVLDNDYKTWGAFSNQYWPREYLIDMDGYVVYDHAGEGDYDKTESAVQAALAERAARMGTTTMPMPSISASQGPDLSGVGSPETYFGSNRNEYLGNGTQGVAGVQTFTLPTTPSPNTLYLNGIWDTEPEYAESQATGADTGGSANSIEYYYSAGNVYFVASAAAPVQVEVLLDGKPVGQWGGDDVDKTTSTVTIGAERLYSLVHTPGPGGHLLELKVKGSGLRAYTFTFG